MCQTCGVPISVQCDCPSPYGTGPKCTAKIDASCVIYHIDCANDAPSQLTCLGLPNCSSVESILEAIDRLVCNNLNIPITVTETFTSKMTASGQAGHTLKTDVKVSDDSGNSMEIRPDGLFTPANSETTFVANDSTTIDFTTSGTHGHTLTGAVKISATGGNIISANSDGIYASDLVETTLVATDTSTIDFTAAGTHGHALTGAVKISATGGNIISANSDGIFAASSTPYTFQNGLTNTSSVIELGGTLLHDTTITEGAHYLNVLASSGTGGLRINDSSSSSGYLYVKGNTGKVYTSVFDTTVPLTNATTFSCVGGLSSVKVNNAGSDFTHTSTSILFAGLYGEFSFNNSTNTTVLNTGIAKSYSGVTGVFTVYQSGDISGGVVSGGCFYSNLAGPNNISDIAAVRTVGAVQTPSQAAFSGTIANYYGVKIEPSADSSFTVTNRWGVYQEGTGDTNYFNGNVGIKTVSPTSSLSVNGSADKLGGGSWGTFSDERIKKDIKPFTDSLAILEQINPVFFKYNGLNNIEDTNKEYVGIVAQDIEKVAPYTVERKKTNEFDDLRVFDPNALVYILINAVKELSEKVKYLEYRLYNK